MSHIHSNTLAFLGQGLFSDPSVWLLKSRPLAALLAVVLDAQASWPAWQPACSGPERCYLQFPALGPATLTIQAARHPLTLLTPSSCPFPLRGLTSPGEEGTQDTGPSHPHGA